MIKPFSPISMAERDKLAASVVRALEEVRECDLENIDLFLGAGIYGLFIIEGVGVVCGVRRVVAG